MGGNWSFPLDSSNIIIICGVRKNDPAHDVIKQSLRELNDLFRGNLNSNIKYPRRNVHILDVANYDYKKDFLKDFNELAAVQSDRILVYYTGHGNETGLSTQFAKETKESQKIDLIQLTKQCYPYYHVLFILECCSISDKTISKCQSRYIGIIKAEDRKGGLAQAGRFRSLFVQHLEHEYSSKFKCGYAKRSFGMPGVWFGGYWWDISDLKPIGNIHDEL